MKTKPWLRTLEACAFLALVFALVISTTGLVERKKSRDLFGGFLEEPALYDVLFFGDSQLMNAMMPLEMWEETGIAGYNMACYGSVMPTTYWSLVNALDYASPKLVVIAINGMNETHKVTNYSGDLHTALDFWPMSANKARTIEDLLHDPDDPDYTDIEGYRYRDLRSEFYFTLGKYHSRWSELTEADFVSRPANSRGGEMLVGVAPIWEYELADENDYAEEGGYSYQYLRMAIELCQSRGIEVLLVHLPAPQYINSQRHANTVGSMAEEYGVGFVDVTYMDSIVDYAVDCVDADPHLNVSGTLKMTDYLASYIASHYDLPDRRDDAHYDHWNAHLQAHKDEKMRRIREEEDLNNLLMLLHDQDVDVQIAVAPEAEMRYDDVAGLLMHNMARERVLAGEEYEKWSSFMYPLEGYDEALADGSMYYMVRVDGVVTEYTGSAAQRAARETFGDVQASVAVRVIDRRDGSLVAQKAF